MYSASTGNTLYYRDNLTVMQSMAPNSVDLVYLDPPFNSNRTYNLLYKQATGGIVPEQNIAYHDTWELDAEKIEMVNRMPIVLREYGVDPNLVEFWRTWMGALKEIRPKLLAYLIYMFYRLLAIRRALTETGSVYLHCDPTASHYIKVLMDGVFGHDNYRNEIVWHYDSPGGRPKRWFAKKHDIILFYTKTEKYYFDTKHDILRVPISDTALAMHFKKTENGRRYRERTVNGKIYRYYADEGKAVDTLWNDIGESPSNSPLIADNLGYPTQKPVKLLQRIIEASCPQDGVVFDPFCGCGTAIYASHLNNRKWIGCDIALLAVKLVQETVETRYGIEEGKHYTLDGIPVTEEHARELFAKDPLHFQDWATQLAGGFPNQRHTGDKGIDGWIFFELIDSLGKKDLKKMVVSVKGGHLRPADIRDLHGVLAADINAEMAAFICLEPPTRQQKEAAAAAGTFEYQGVTYNRIQIRTVAELLNNQPFNTPTKVRLIHKEKQYGLAL